MQEVVWLAEPIRIWIEGGTWAEVTASKGFRLLALLCAMLVPSTIIALGIGMTEWRETPLANYFGFHKQPDDDWTLRARDLDGDGSPDF